MSSRDVNTFLTTDAVGNREQLSDVVSRITPEDTPILSLIGTGTVNGTHPEWETETLAPPGENAQIEGNDFQFGTITPATRMGNYTQIMSKSFLASGSQNAEDNAGDAEKGLKKQLLKKGIELKKDVEFSIVAANGSDSGDTRKSGSLSTWLTSNVSRGVGGQNGGFSQANGKTTAPTNGTKRTFTKGLLDATMQSCYESGGNVTQMVCSPYVKSVFVGFMIEDDVAAFRYSANSGKNNTIVANADIYEGPFGKVTVIPDRVMTTPDANGNADALSRNVFLIDPEYLRWDWFRKIAQKPVANTGDADKKALLGEGTLRVKNEAANGVIADVYGINANT